MFMYRRPPAKRPPTVLPTPVLAELEAAFADKPFGTAGEMLPLPDPSPPPAPAPAFVIEPWPEEQRRAEAAAVEPAPDVPNVTAVEAVMHRAKELGELQEPEAPMFAPPLKLQPLVPVAIPEPDWRLEEKQARWRRQAERREHAQRVLAEQGDESA